MEVHTVSIFGLHMTAYKLPGMLRKGCKLSKSFNQLLCAVILEPFANLWIRCFGDKGDVEDITEGKQFSRSCPYPNF
jgi:hypothetical protein